ncbi:hypothetical protein ACHAXN_000208 [Cyclotella atomus]
MVMVKIDSNAILVEPMKSRKDAEIIRAYDTLILRLKRAGISPKKHVLDNEISENMKNHIRDDCQFQLELVPPGCHRRNAAEVAIQNFKAHFLSVLAGTTSSFPPSLWDRLLPQTEITLNLLRQSNATPNVSAYAHLSGPFDYNKMPLAPMGCEVQIHKKTDKRGTWAYHSVDGWYLNTSQEHYRGVHNCYTKETRSERLSDMVVFKHKHMTNPTMMHADKLMQALANCKSALQGVTNGKQDQQLQELQQIVEQAGAHIHQITNSQAQQDTMTAHKNQQIPRVHTDTNTEPVPRVQPTTNPEPVPRVHTRSTAQLHISSSNTRARQ